MFECTTIISCSCHGDDRDERSQSIPPMPSDCVCACFPPLLQQTIGVPTGVVADGRLVLISKVVRRNHRAMGTCNTNLSSIEEIFLMTGITMVERCGYQRVRPMQLVSICPNRTQTFVTKSNVTDSDNNGLQHAPCPRVA